MGNSSDPDSLMEEPNNFILLCYSFFKKFEIRNTKSETNSKSEFFNNRNKSRIH